MFCLGAIAGGCRLLGRGRGFAGASSFGVGVLSPLTLGTAPVVLAPGAVEGRGPGRPMVKDVARLRVAGRDEPFVVDADDGGREKEGRADDVPLKDCREDEREGVDWDDGWRTETGIGESLHLQAYGSSTYT